MDSLPSRLPAAASWISWFFFLKLNVKRNGSLDLEYFIHFKGIKWNRPIKLSRRLCSFKTHRFFHNINLYLIFSDLKIIYLKLTFFIDVLWYIHVPFFRLKMPKSLACIFKEIYVYLLRFPNTNFSTCTCISIKSYAHWWSFPANLSFENSINRDII